MILVGSVMYVYGAIIGTSVVVMFVTRHLARRIVEKLGLAYYDRYMNGGVVKEPLI